MEKNIEENYNHIINIIERKTITLTGIKKILEKTKYGSDGIGGIETKGKMKIGYPKINIE